MELEQTYSELLFRIEHLAELYQQMDAHVTNTISWFVAILVGVFAIIGAALYFLARALAKDGVDKAIGDVNSKISSIQSCTDVNTAKLKELESLSEGYRMVDGEKEYFFPPLYPYVEYRTVERFTGRNPVYTILLQSGEIPALSTKSILLPNDKNIDFVVRANFSVVGSSKSLSISYSKRGDGVWVSFESKELVSIPEAFAQIWYTKKS